MIGIHNENTYLHLIPLRTDYRGNDNLLLELFI